MKIRAISVTVLYRKTPFSLTEKVMGVLTMGISFYFTLKGRTIGTENPIQPLIRFTTKPMCLMIMLIISLLMGVVPGNAFRMKIFQDRLSKFLTNMMNM